MKYLVFTTAALAEVRQLTLAQAMGYPDAQAKTTRYANIIPHPTDLRALLPIAPCYDQATDTTIDTESLLTSDEVAALQTQIWVEGQGWFPVSNWGNS